MNRVWSVGHGTLSADAFESLLRDAGITAVADIRRYPASRRHPHFHLDAMQRWLPAAGLGYQWISELGGRRRPAANSAHTALRNDQFRAYADHMTTPEFALGVARLVEQVAGCPTAVMCAESLWWRCHRRLLADHLTLIEGVGVSHLFHDGRIVEHEPLEVSRVHEGVLIYADAPPTSLLGESPSE